jgi:hypothetical protein
MHLNLCQSYALCVLLFPGIEWKLPRLSYIKHLQSLQICISFTFLLQTHLYWFHILLSDRVQTWGSFLVLSAGKVLSTWDGSNFSFESIKWGAQLEWYDQYRLPPCGPIYISLFLSQVVAGTGTYKKPHEQHWSIFHIFRLLFGTWDLHWDLHCTSLSFSSFSSLMCTQLVLLTLLHIMFAECLNCHMGCCVLDRCVVHIHTILFTGLLLRTANQTCLEWTLASNQA